EAARRCPRLHRLGGSQHAGCDRPPSGPLRGGGAQRRHQGRPDAGAVRGRSPALCGHVRPRGRTCPGRPAAGRASSRAGALRARRHR
ncbi:MAG: 1-deoxy-D-xylulose 5-phosphate reductoisomerase, partial [uncultured Ramlibacter sp.]